MIRNVECPVCGARVQYDDNQNPETFENDYATTLCYENGEKLNTHVKYIVCPECSSDVDVVALNIRLNPRGERMSMEVIYY